MTNCRPSSIPTFTEAPLRAEPNLVTAALIAGLLQPTDLDPICPAHVGGFHDALRTSPGLHIPPAMLPTMNQETLFQLCAIDTIATELVERLITDAITLTPSTLKYLTVPNPLPPAVEQALLTLFLTGRLTTEQRETILTRWRLTKATSAAIQTNNRHAGAKRAAATRATTRQAHRAAGVTPPSAPCAKDPLLAALTGKATQRVSRFHLESLDPARFQRVLPAWLQAGPEIVALLLRVPRISPELQRTALEAAATNYTSWLAITDPIAGCVLPQLSVKAVDLVFSELFRKRLLLDPPLTDQELTDTLFRTSLQDPHLAAWITQNFTLSTWRDELTRLTDKQPSIPPVPKDPEAHWISVLSSQSWSVPRATALTLHRLFLTWDSTRQAALAVPLLAIVDACFHKRD